MLHTVFAVANRHIVLSSAKTRQQADRNHAAALAQIDSLTECWASGRSSDDYSNGAPLTARCPALVAA